MMKLLNALIVGLAALAAAAFSIGTASAAETPPVLTTFSVPAAGDMQLLFRGGAGPFMVQTRATLDPMAVWVDVPNAVVTELQTGVYLAFIPGAKIPMDLGFYRIVSEGDPAFELKGWTMLLRVSTPANGTHFVAGESPVVTVSILDTLAKGLGFTTNDFSTISLYAYGPEEPQNTITPVKLLNATADRTKTPHHYINLLANADVKVDGTTLTYSLKPVSDELPGTYTLGVRAVLKADEVQQLFKFASIQIGNATVEAPVATKDKCAACHEGADNGKMYMHHIDVSSRSRVGSWSLDYEPVTSCKLCHNNDGYAAFTETTATATNRVPDHIVLRVHGVHNGANLKLYANTNQVNGNFRDYTSVVFPSNAKDCAKCHSDDRWQTKPARMACGACHDNVWFADNTAPSGYVMHTGGQQKDDTKCSLCHAPGTIAGAHALEKPDYKQTIQLTMSLPGNGKYFVAGEAPTVTIQVTDVATGKLVNPTNIVEPLVSTNVQPNEWRRGNLIVAGPRADTVPVLTTAAAILPSTASYANNDFRVRVDPKKEDPRVSRTDEAVLYKLADVAGLAPGTYTVYAEVQGSKSGVPGGMSFMNFQVGTATIEPMPASKCTDCHSDMRMHETSRAAQFNPDICKVCHDNLHQMTGKTNWSNSQWGFGVGPLVRKVHGVHYGNYTSKPNELNGGAFAEVIFPQDVRNCTSCHVTTSWIEKPARLACMACHDTDAALMHGNLMTFDPTPSDPWSGDEVETCEICHGKDAEFNAKAVHSIGNPYVPPYPRAPREP